MMSILVVGLVITLLYIVGKNSDITQENKKYNYKSKHAAKKSQQTISHMINHVISLVEDPKKNNQVKSKQDVFSKMEKRQRNLENNLTNETDELADDEAYFGRIEDEEECVTMSPEVDDGEVFTDTQWETLASQQTIESKKQSGKRTPLQQAYILSEIFSKPKGLD